MSYPYYSFTVEPSTAKNKKLKVCIYKDGLKIKTLHVGDTRYYDYIQYYRDNPALANERRLLYLSRHSKEDKDFLKKSFWADKLLWNKPTLQASIRSINLNK